MWRKQVVPASAGLVSCLGGACATARCCHVGVPDQALGQIREEPERPRVRLCRIHDVLVEPDEYGIDNASGQAAHSVHCSHCQPAQVSDS